MELRLLLRKGKLLPEYSQQTLGTFSTIISVSLSDALLLKSAAQYFVFAQSRSIHAAGSAAVTEAGATGAVSSVSLLGSVVLGTGPCGSQRVANKDMAAMTTPTQNGT